MDTLMCALCDRAILPGDRARFLGIEKLLLHGVCYDDALEGLTDDVPRWRMLEGLRLAARDERST